MIFQRSMLRWLLFGACVAVFLAAMLWVTQQMLSMDRQRQLDEREAQVQERVRLSLWRMDSLVNTLLIRENSRPPNHYQPFHAPDDLFSNRSQRELPKGEAVMPSPLLGDPPEFVQLHFELLQGVARSPQVPTGKDLTLANNWYAISPQINTAQQHLAQLKQLLLKHPQDLTAEPQRSQRSTVKPPTAAAKPQELNVPTAALEKQLSKTQQMANNVELETRAKVASNVSIDKLGLSSLPKKKAELATPAPQAPAGASIAQAPAAATRQAMAESAGAKADSNAVRDERAASATSVIDPQTAPTDLKPHWIDNELFLTRTATVDSQSRVQGLWLDWPSLRARLLETIRDLLPEAQLFASDQAALDASSMVTLPVRLLPGTIAWTSPDGSPLQRSLTIAWACFLIAAIAVGLVLHRAILLSERRGAFVSAVTHELRTPLTTFQLYSEMLADDMVPDANQRREYLRTLCNESTRLTHLVENVLAYSRIERGRTAARRENLLLADLIARMEPRLRQRIQPTGLNLQVHVAADAATARLDVDALAVEQIVFNLIDNACKYAAPSSTEPSLQVDVSVGPKQAVIHVRDHGPGFSKPQLKRLFQPFEKSATEAAHSAPGVGLGLALCRQLARELGGDLVLESACPGACFKLTLPRSQS